MTPLALEGHVGGWLEVCDAVDAMEVDTIAPGHGPIGGKAELGEMRGYLRSVRDQARAAFDAGRSERDAARGIDLGEYASWAEPERLPLNVGRLYQEFRGRSEFRGSRFEARRAAAIARGGQTSAGAEPLARPGQS